MADDDAMLAQLRAERDATREEVAFLKEQLRSLTAYHTHLLKQESQWMLDELARIATHLSVLREELHRRTSPGAIAARSSRLSLTAVSSDGHADGAGMPASDGAGDGTGMSSADGDGTGTQ